MNLISIVQQLPEDDILFVQTYVEMIEEKNKKLEEKINKAINIIESYNLGKYDYSIPSIGIDDLLKVLK